MNTPHNLGELELKRMQKEGWGLDDRGLRVGNGWVMWATDPGGNLRIIMVADPDDEPEKFPSLLPPPARDVPEQRLLPF